MRATVRTDGDRLIAERRLGASPERVWAAFTTPADLAGFWGGGHATVTPGSVHVDLRPGGEFGLETRVPDGRTGRLLFVYEVIERPTRLVFGEPRTGLVTTVRIEADGDGSLLTVHQHRLPPELRTIEAATGLGSIIDRLADHLGEHRQPEVGA